LYSDTDQFRGIETGFTEPVPGEFQGWDSMIHPVVFTTTVLRLEFDNARHDQSSQGNMKKMAGFGLSISSAEITAFREGTV